MGSRWKGEWSMLRLSLLIGLWIWFLAWVCMGWVLWGVEGFKLEKRYERFDVEDGEEVEFSKGMLGGSQRGWQVWVNPTSPKSRRSTWVEYGVREKNVDRKIEDEWVRTMMKETEGMS